MMLNIFEIGWIKILDLRKKTYLVWEGCMTRIHLLIMLQVPLTWCRCCSSRLRRCLLSSSWRCRRWCWRANFSCSWWCRSWRTSALASCHDALNPSRRWKTKRSLIIMVQYSNRSFSLVKKIWIIHDGIYLCQWVYYWNRMEHHYLFHQWLLGRRSTFDPHKYQIHL